VVGKPFGVPDARSLLPWWLPAVLVAPAPLVMGPAFDGALNGRSTSVGVVASVALWGTWLVALVAALVRSSLSLTVLRGLVPLAPASAIVAMLTGASAAATVVAVGWGALLTIATFTAEVGGAFVQASAYGDERRFLLRLPAPLLVIVPVSWILAAGALGAGVLALAAQAWVAGAMFTLAGGVAAALLAPRYHRLVGRLLVLVPGGLVLRDPLVLADTAMFRRAQIDGVDLAEAGTEALDLTGGAPGLALEVRLRETGTVLRAGTLAARQGTSVHVRAFLCAPSRPGLALAAFRERGLARR
jgi:hypothetical protein